MSEPVEIVRVPFHGTELLTVDADGQPHIVFKPAIEGLGLDYATQFTKLRRRSWACVGQRPMQLPGDTQSRSHVTVDVRTFLMMLATVDENRVPEHIRPLLVAYQREVADVIESYWTKGAAVQPSVEVGPQHEIPPTYAEALRKLADEHEARLAAEGQVVELETTTAEQGKELGSARPKAAYVDAFINPAEDVTTIGDFAKELGIREKDLREYLVRRKRIYKRVLPRRWSARHKRETVEYEWRYHAGYESWFSMRDQPDAPRLHNGQMRMTLYVTPIGKERIHRLLATDPIGGAA